MRLSSDGAHVGSRLPPAAAQGAAGVLRVVADPRVQPEPASGRRPQLHPVALRHPGHLDPRTLVPPGPTLPYPEARGRAVPSDRGSGQPIRSSLRISIEFMMTNRRLRRVSWPCRSRYATSAIRSPSSDRGWHPGEVPPAGRHHPSAPPPGQIETGDMTCTDGDRKGLQETWRGAKLPARVEHRFA